MDHWKACGNGDAGSCPGLLDPRHPRREVKVRVEHRVHDPIQYRVVKRLPPRLRFVATFDGRYGRVVGWLGTRVGMPYQRHQGTTGDQRGSGRGQHHAESQDYGPPHTRPRATEAIPGPHRPRRRLSHVQVPYPTHGSRLEHSNSQTLGKLTRGANTTMNAALRWNNLGSAGRWPALEERIDPCAGLGLPVVRSPRRCWGRIRPPTLAPSFLDQFKLGYAQVLAASDGRPELQVGFVRHGIRRPLA